MSEQYEGEHPATGEQPEKRRQVTRFAFFKLLPEWRSLSAEERESQKSEFASVIEELQQTMMIRSYSTMGTRGDCDFLLWQASQELDTLQTAATRIFSTAMGRYLTVPISYLAMTKKSIYIEQHVHEGQDGTRLALKPTNAKYLFVYPFIKKRSWYMLPKEQRQVIMDEHIRVGTKYPRVKLNTTYSFGLDDQEFVVAFETNYPEDFLDLVMELRGSESSSYTERDVPIFTCRLGAVREVLDALGGTAAERELSFAKS